MKLRSIITLCFLFAATGLMAQIPALERVEPMNWWVGMKNPRLQLLVHGKDIASSNVSLSYPGVKLAAVHKVENANYLFVDLVIAPTTRPGKFPITFKKAGAKDLTYTYELKLRNKSPLWAQGVTDKDLIYLLMPDRFSNGDPTNDVKADMYETGLARDSMYSRHGGDIQGLMNHLDYLKDLGVTAIWMTPEIENDEPHASYHGYAVTDYYKIDPRYGTNELYKAYVAKCHSMGLKVIKDLVHNHIGTESWLIRDIPMKSWVHQWPKYTNSNFKENTIVDPHGNAIDKKITLDGWFDHRMADVNQSNPYVQNYLTQNHIWWVEYAGIDGFRLDTYFYNEPVYMADWAKKVQAEFPHFTMFGETIVTSVANQAYFTQGNTVNRGFDTHMPGITDAQMKDAFHEALNGKEGWTSGVNGLYGTVSEDFMYQDPTRNCIFLDNHDETRFLSIVNEDFTKYKAGMAMLLTMRGIPQMYYGDEILMAGIDNPDGLVRSDFPGGWDGDKKNKFTEAGRDKKENEAFNYVRTLANYRKNTTALQNGKMMQYIPRDGVYTYFRYDAQKTVMICYNGRDKEQTITTDHYYERTTGFTGGVDVISKKPITDLKQITIPAKTTLVIELTK